MRGRAIRRIPVVEEGRPASIVSLGDIAEARERESVLADISAAPSNN
jgi:CBS domain-containing protein